MTRPAISGIAPFFIVRSVPAALSFYRDRLGFSSLYRPLGDDDDGSRGFEVKDADGYLLFFGRPRS